MSAGRLATAALVIAAVAAGALWRTLEWGASPGGEAHPPRALTAAGSGEAELEPPLATIEEALDGEPAPLLDISGRRRVIAHKTDRALEIDLIEDPALSYGHVNWTEADRVYANAARALPGVVYDPLLGHAARELAYLYSVEDGLVPSGALEFVLMSAGAAEWGVRQSLTGTTSQDFAAIEERVAEVARAAAVDGGTVRVGIGEAYEPGATPPRTIAVLAAQGDLRLDPLRKEVARNQLVRITGSLPRGATAPRAVAMWPDNTVEEVGIQTTGERFRLELPAGPHAGELWVELIATGKQGPKPLAQLTFYVDLSVPTAWRGGYPPDESGYRTVEQCEARAYELLDADRAGHDLPPLRRDPSLDAIARAHSQDMRDRGFFGHVSPATGSVGDRLRSARIATVSYAENVARNSSLADAQQGLMWSLGHRVNILSRRFERVGLGVAVETNEKGRRTFFITQVFATPAAALSPAGVRRDVLRRLANERALAELGPLHLDPALEQVAAEQAHQPGATPQSALARVSEDDRIRGAVVAWVSSGFDAEEMEPPEAVYDAKYQRVGVGVRVEPGDLDHPVTVVVLLSGS